MLSVQPGVQNIIHDATRGNDQENKMCYSSMDFTKLHIYMNFSSQKLIFPILKMCSISVLQMRLIKRKNWFTVSAKDSLKA